MYKPSFCKEMRIFLPFGVAGTDNRLEMGTDIFSVNVCMRLSKINFHHYYLKKYKLSFSVPSH